MQATANNTDKRIFPRSEFPIQPGILNNGRGDSNNAMRKKIFVISIDLIFLFLSMLFALKYFGYSLNGIRNYYFLLFLALMVVWVIMGVVFDKYGFRLAFSLKINIAQIFLTNLAFLGLLISFLYYIKVPFIDKKVVFASGLIITAFEVFFVFLWKFFFKGTDTFLYEGPTSPPFENLYNKHSTKIVEKSIQSNAPFLTLSSLREQIISEVGEAAYIFIKNHFGDSPHQVLVVSTSTRFNILAHQPGYYSSIVNLKRINDIQYINKFYEAVNSRIPNGGLFIGTAETYVQRKKRILAKYPRGLNWVVYTVDFLVKRVMPKLWFTKKIYFFITRGQNRVISMAETLGRLYSCGFEVVEDCFIDGQLWFCARKVKEPAFDYHPTYGPLIRLKRLGKNGKVIGVYKLRTMHAYSEYLQQYVYERNSLQEGGKFKDDFRITTLGRFMRKIWLDELPMLINVIKGDLKIVGVRPLSKHYLSLYTPELREWRLKHKPGLIPPFYVDLPKTLDEIMASEIKYLKAYEKHPLITDFSYFFKAMYNIFIKKARSN
ncbi:MAG: hypothetical protein PWP07_1281 [Epulopiscium sp.]|nr:hypothetical protein [Candidatus Epulonipiscium sp.]